MSSKETIKFRDRTANQPGFHVYVDLLDGDFADLVEADELPVYVQFDGVSINLQVTQPQSASVTVVLPRETARALGLVPQPVSQSTDDAGGAE